MSLIFVYIINCNITKFSVYFNHREEVIPMAKKKRRKPKQAAQPRGWKTLAGDILAGVTSGLITAAILRLLKW